MQTLHTPTIGSPPPLISSLKTLTLGIEELYNLFGDLRGGKFVVLYGSHICHVLSELLCVRSQLPYVEGGLDSPIVFIDGGNLFDPYLISETARLLKLKPEETLKNIWVSRAFTAYQLTALITEKLPEILNQEDAKIVVVSDIAALYCDPDIALFEAKRTFNWVTRFLWNLARERDLLLVANSLPSRGQRKRRLEQYLLARADIVVKAEAGNPCVKVTLEKHPFKPPATVNLYFGETETQSLLEDFVAV
jgi:hypothetical protein